MYAKLWTWKLSKVVIIDRARSAVFDTFVKKVRKRGPAIFQYQKYWSANSCLILLCGKRIKFWHNSTESLALK